MFQLINNFKHKCILEKHFSASALRLFLKSIVQCYSCLWRWRSRHDQSWFLEESANVSIISQQNIWVNTNGQKGERSLGNFRTTCQIHKCSGQNVLARNSKTVHPLGFGPVGLRAPHVVVDGSEAGHCFYCLFSFSFYVQSFSPTYPGSWFFNGPHILT